ncbi:uncharacterized protein PAC_01454 [Phialocephala subalpina]|uniref:2EXR domain-containing protein n=1 Tax=Phialocephala subalpina TaxID=576137 RepID=A0A1L7WFP1_9HELO|nr:uncharacterized protein PAC_01454 [Phialocephala subalpina]
MTSLLIASNASGTKPHLLPTNPFLDSILSTSPRIFKNNESQVAMASTTDATETVAATSTARRGESEEITTSWTDAMNTEPDNLNPHLRELEKAMPSLIDATEVGSLNHVAGQQEAQQGLFPRPTPWRLRPSTSTHNHEDHRQYPPLNDAPSISSGTLTIEDSSTEEPKFMLFPRLPIELRLKIWQCAIPLFPRIIEIRRQGYTATYWTANISSASTLLNTSEESRDAVARFYENPPDLNVKISDERRTNDMRINLEVDTLFLDVDVLPYDALRGSLVLDQYLGEVFGTEYAQKVKSRLKNLALDWRLAYLPRVQDSDPGFEKLPNMMIVFKLHPWNESGRRLVGLTEFARPHTAWQDHVLEIWQQNTWAPMNLAICERVFNGDVKEASEVAGN